jgi:hypothetical protein
MGFTGTQKRLAHAVAFAMLGVTSLGVSSASAVQAPAFSLHAWSEPSTFSPADIAACAEGGPENAEKCDQYQILLTNVGDASSSGPVTIADTLPAGVTFSRVNHNAAYGVDGNGEGERWECSPAENAQGRQVVTCEFPEAVPVGNYAPPLALVVSPPSGPVAGPLLSEISVTGGGTAMPVSMVQETPVSPPPAWGVREFAIEPAGGNGEPLTGAGAHPWELTTSIGMPIRTAVPDAPRHEFQPAENVRSITVELPAGLTGDPLTAPRCTPTELAESSGPNVHGFSAALNSCPVGSEVGAIAFIGAFAGSGEINMSGGGNMTPIFNMAPQAGYPAEFAFKADGVPVYLFANVVNTASGYALRITTPGIPEIVMTTDVVLTFFGDPGQVDGEPSQAAFLGDPMDCSTSGLTSRIEAESYEDPGHLSTRETVVYPSLSGCGLLSFAPSFTFAPSVAEGGTTQADEPSGYTAVLKVPQTSAFSELATPQVKDVSVTLPAGVAISPSAADGLVGCDEAQIALDSTEAGACPLASQIGSAEAVSPVLPNPLEGHVYLASPKCGGEGQPACTEASASNGELFGLYLEVQGPGFAVKFPGVVSVNPATGQVTTRFENLIQQAVSEVKLQFKAGPRAPLANPQSCGTASTASDITPWSTPATPDAVGSSSFNVDWDGNGGACPASLPFSPGFTAGTENPAAGAFSPFTLTVTRHDREQDLSAIAVSTPPGLAGILKGVALCAEPQAAQGTCPAAAQIGTTTVAVGSGSHPYWVQGRVYLTGPYKDQPFGLSVVVPAVAGPFNLGNVVVRASIHVDPHTAALTIASDPLPQTIDGVPLRVQTVNVTIDRPGFTYNPTNCNQLQMTGTIAAAQGASSSVSSPFAVTGCKSLAFSPSFTVSTQAKTSKQQGASLNVRYATPAGQANTAKVDVTLPKQLPARLTTIQQACTEAAFAANPASCPAASEIGTATATTPVFASPLSGPMYLVSRGGAAFPDVVAILQGENVTVDLTGNVNIKNGITSSSFETVPDAPISVFEMQLPEGPHSGLAANLPAKAKGSFCGQSLTMPTTIVAQNGAQITQSTKIAVSGCPKAKKKAKVKQHRHRARRRKGAARRR